MGGETNPDQRKVGQRILIVSMDCVLRERLYDWLTRQGYCVTTVSSGKVGLETLQHERPDLIVANSGADNCGGWGIADCVRRFDASLPIILLARVEKESFDGRTVRDIQALLPHDVSQHELLVAVTRWLSPPPSSTPSLGYVHPILLIDDEPQLLHDLEAFLRPRGCSVVTAQSGGEALQKLQMCNPALVLLDIKMRGMDGLVTLKKIKAMRPNLPVIMATAVEDQELMTQAFALGAYEYVTKPFNLRALQDLLLHLKQLINR
jgi:DNA-binding response OmpR family regulator